VVLFPYGQDLFVRERKNLKAEERPNVSRKNFSNMRTFFYYVKVICFTFQLRLKFFFHAFFFQACQCIFTEMMPNLNVESSHFILE